MTSQQLQERWEQASRRYPVQTFERVGATSGHAGATCEHAGTTWRYRASGDREHTLVALPGALGGAGAYFVLMAELESRHRVLAVDIPDTASIREVTDGIVDLLNREGVESASFLGGSFGGLLVQAFAKSHPERVARLILAQTGPPGGIPPGQGRRWARIVSVLPTGLIRWLLMRLVRAMLKRKPGTEFWLPFYSEEIKHLDRQGLVSRYLLTSDLVESYDWTPQAADAWSGSVTILLSRKDAMVGSKARAALLALYPDADTKVLPTEGHGAYVSDPFGFSRAVAAAMASRSHRPDPT